jgi:hypothetical protein
MYRSVIGAASGNGDGDSSANFLFNPSHVDAAKFFVAEAFSYPFDYRLKT